MKKLKIIRKLYNDRKRTVPKGDRDTGNEPVIEQKNAMEVAPAEMIRNSKGTAGTRCSVL